MARRHTGTVERGTDADQGVIVIPPALLAAISAPNKVQWTAAEMAMLRATFPIAARNGRIRELAAAWHTLGKDFPPRPPSQLTAAAARAGLTGRRP